MPIFDEDTPRWVRALLWGIAALVVAVVALVVTLVVVLQDDDGRGPTPTPQTGSPSASTPEAGECPPLPASDEIPNELTVSEWTTLPNGLTAPTSPDVGPAREKGRVHSCFAKSPMGAAMSTVWFVVESSGSVDEEMADQMWLRLSAATKEFAEQGGIEFEADPPNRDIELIGYRFVDVQEERVIGEILFHDLSADTFTGVTQIQVWEDGDWRVDKSPSGEVDTRVVTDSSAFMALNGPS